jgi:hypothetical protein
VTGEAAWSARRPPTESSCQLCDRVGNLFDEPGDHWWDFDLNTDAEQLAAELLELLHARALGWLEQRGSLERVLAMVSERPESLGWHELRGLPRVLRDAGHPDAADALLAEAARRGSP